MAHTRSGRRTTASPPFIIRYGRRHLGFLAGLVITAVVVGVVYRYLFDPLEEREPLNYLRSGLHETGVAISGWAFYLGLAAAPQSRLRTVLRRLPQAAELAIKTLVMTAVLTIITVGLQLVLYPVPFFSESRVVQELSRILHLAFCGSLVTVAIFEFRRLIGGRVLGSFLLGT
jgi:hypothetical protein